jgi:endo-1,4-beta-xylanase
MFGVNEAISREDMAVMMYRAAKSAQIELTQSEDVHEPFMDADLIASYSFEAIEAIQQASGFEDGTFRPVTIATLHK